MLIIPNKLNKNAPLNIGVWPKGGSTNNSYGLKVDDKLDLSSTNPVQNKIISRKINDIESTLENRLSDILNFNIDKADEYQLSDMMQTLNTIIQRFGGNQKIPSKDIEIKSDDYSIYQIEITQNQLDKAKGLLSLYLWQYTNTGNGCLEIEIERI